MTLSPIAAGIDLAGHERPLGYAILDASARLIDLRREAMTDDDLVALASSCGVSVVAIDAPLSLPDGMCCLDAGCACAPSHPRGMRTAELALRAAGLGCYATTKRTIIRALVERGMALRQRLEAHGLRAVEAYPYGSKVRLFGRPPATRRNWKKTPEGRRWLTERLRSLVAGLPQEDLDDDRADAILAAYTGLLLALGRAEALGEAAEDCIWLPAAKPLLAGPSDGR